MRKIVNGCSTRFEGWGDDIVRFLEPTDGYMLARFNHRGDDHVSVWSMNEYLQKVDLLVNAVGNYRGDRIFGVDEAIAALEISASGAWNLQLLELKDLPTLSEGRSQFVGDTVIRATTAAEPSEVAYLATFDVRSDEHVAVHAYALQGGLLVNDIGPYRGTVVVPAGSQLLTVDAAGPWELSVERGPASPVVPVPTRSIEAPDVGTATGLAAELEKLRDLRDAGVLSEAEFEEAKRRVISKY
ncbi:SHOCT domain-containing protein [Aeromicrobium sp. NPDC092404]|uniref:SHOCT domain-containing protein n=1 Tax=Aeromicrobium sp. NPDC092404 TaxID=3154976 RepID=UPI003448536F